MKIAQFAALSILTLIAIVISCGAPSGNTNKCTEDGCWGSDEYRSSYTSIDQEERQYYCKDHPSDPDCCSNDAADPRPYCD